MKARLGWDHENNKKKKVPVVTKDIKLTSPDRLFLLAETKEDKEFILSIYDKIIEYAEKNIKKKIVLNGKPSKPNR